MFEVFQEHFWHWRALFALRDWSIECCEGTLPQSVQARTYMNWTQRAARCVWNVAHHPPDDAVITAMPEDVALHEMLHIVLNALVSLAVASESADAFPVDAEEHAVIRRLMHALKKGT